MKKAGVAILLIILLMICGCIPVDNLPVVWKEPSSFDTPDSSATPAVPVIPSTPDEPSVPSEPETPEEPEIPNEPEKPKNTVIKIVAAGDNLLHNTISFDAAKDDGTYDFSKIYDRIRHIPTAAQISFVNQEIMLTGKVSGYPSMEAPAEAADALLGAGFNIINLASNHTLDKGEEGLEACIKNVKKRDFDAILGVYETEEESKNYSIVEKNGIVFGFLSYTYGMNGGNLSKGNEWKVDLIDEPKMVKDMKALRPLCDYLIVSMHWGAEYVTEPTSYQRRLGQVLCDYGADLIIGTHPHVLQPLEILKSEKNDHQTICAWSLGNFISNQHRLDTMLGGLLQVELIYDEEKKLIETRSSIIPTVTHYSDKSRDYEIYLLEEYTEELASEHGIRKFAESPLTLQYLKDLAKQVVGDNIADEIY
ncbi:MAG: CapA family protein [Clostridia bacterium]|nr:CapA family protein [Clostridia bacterium]